MMHLSLKFSDPLAKGLCPFTKTKENNLSTKINFVCNAIYKIQQSPVGLIGKVKRPLSQAGLPLESLDNRGRPFNLAN